MGNPILMAGVAGLLLLAGLLSWRKLTRTAEALWNNQRSAVYCTALLGRRLEDEARRRAHERVAELGAECEDHLIQANLATQLRQVNMAAACRRAAQRCANEAHAIAREAQL